MKINVMLGGLKPNKLPNGTWCGVDGGAKYLIEKGIYPEISCGDFDSITIKDKDFIKNISKHFFEKNSQDLTDSQFALNKIISTYPTIKEIDIYGATGNRLDHFFGNILLLNNEKYIGIKIRIVDDNNIIELANKGENIYTNDDGYKYFSLVPIYEDTYVTILGAKYEVKDLKLTLTHPNATSNEFFKSEIVVTTTKRCLIIYSKD